MVSQFKNLSHRKVAYMGWVEVIVLALVQGLTEFLPVSSSGHLVVANALLEELGWPPAENLVEVNIVLHLGTLLAILTHYRKEILRLVGNDWRVLGYLLAGTIPAAVVGFYVKKILPDAMEKQVLENVLLAGWMFPVTAVLLIYAMRKSPGEKDYMGIGYTSAIAIGVAQALAILPGISRSGATIAAGIGFGMQREAAATFAFLLAIPAIAGAGLLEGLEAWEQGSTGTPVGVLVVGFIVSFVVGWVSLLLLIRFLRRGRLALFAWYLIPLGIAVIGWQLWERLIG
ncbi:MAG: undecaprenyl-diphosphate phosphatase [Aeoliella sp.]